MVKGTFITITLWAGNSKAMPKGKFRVGYTEDQDERMPIGRASELFGIPISTLHRKVKSPEADRGFTPIGEAGRALSAEEEDVIVLGDFGVPLQPIHVRHLVKLYLDKVGKEVPSYVGNLLSVMWGWSFMKRHSGRISLHVVRNIKVIISSLVDLWHDIGHIDYLRVSKGLF